MQYHTSKKQVLPKNNNSALFCVALTPQKVCARSWYLHGCVASLQFQQDNRGIYYHYTHAIIDAYISRISVSPISFYISTLLIYVCPL